MTFEMLEKMFADQPKIIGAELQEGKLTLQLSCSVSEIAKIAFFRDTTNHMASLPSEARKSFTLRSVKFVEDKVEINVPEGLAGIAAHDFKKFIEGAHIVYVVYVVSEQARLKKEEEERITRARIFEQRAKGILNSLDQGTPPKPRIVENEEDSDES